MIKIICVGKVKEKYLRDAISDYEKRISKYYKIDIIEVNDSNMKEEAIKIKQHIKSNDYVITLKAFEEFKKENESVLKKLK